MIKKKGYGHHTFPQIPNAYFDIEKWFFSTFKKSATTGKTVGYNFNYEDHLNLFLHATFIVKEENVYVHNAFNETIEIIPIHVYNKYVLRGEWDDPTYTTNERKLAWKIECLSNKQMQKYDKEPEKPSESLRNVLEFDSDDNSDDHSDFDFYDYDGTGDDIQSVIENRNISSNLRNALLNKSSADTPRNSYDWTPPTFPGLSNSEPLLNSSI